MPKKLSTNGNGCPICKMSKGEISVRNFFKNNNIEIVHHHVFNDCFLNKNLEFDFFVPKYNTCVEYDGVQHYKPIDHFGGNQSFKKQKERDEIKNDYCEKNKIRLIRISFENFNNIYDILNKEFFQKNDF